VEAASGELQQAVDKAVKEVTARLTEQATGREELMQKEFAGEKNVLLSRIEAAQQTVKEQGEQITRLAGQLDSSRTQVQDIAVKAIESSAKKPFVNVQSPPEQARRGGKDDN